MSEKIYAWLLRLYPSHFREAYGDEALQLFRDRAAHEKGFLRRLRLWLDLLSDAAISVPRRRRSIPSALVGAAARSCPGGAPSFHVLEQESLRPGALLFGGVLSLFTFAACAILIGRSGEHRPFGVPSGPDQAPVWERWFASARSSPEAGAADSPDRPRTTAPAASANMESEAARRRRIIEAAIMNLKRYYVSPDMAQRITDALVAHENAGDDDVATDGGAFASLLTKQMQDASHDRHLEVVYSATTLPDRPQAPSPDAMARYRKQMEQTNCTFEKVEVLARNIGYVKLNSFPDPSVCRSTAAAAMASVNHADAIIFDLRDNRGGYPGMVSFIAAWLFDHPEYLYNPRENTTEQSWTRSPVPGSRLADKPAWILTSRTTISGAEQFSYDLKMLKRATIVGETTRGAAHAGSFHRIDDHFGIAVPETRAINPFAISDWEATGVEPDVRVKAADALITAEKLAKRVLRMRKTTAATQN